MNEYQRHESEREFTADESAPERSPEEIERDIERTRERMSSNIDALGDRLSPDNLKNQAKEAISGKAQDVVSNVGDQARRTGSRVIDFITQNPLPVAAVGLGAIWLFGLRNRSEVSGDRMARFAYTGPERREPDGRPGLGRRLADRAEHVKDKMGDVTSHAGERTGELKHRMQERAGELGSGAKERAREAKGGLERMMHENPLAIAVGAAVIGVGLGMLLPESDREREMMGPARDRLGDRVQNTAERVKDATVEAGREIKDTVKEEVAYHGPEVKSTLKDAAATVGQQVKESAGRVAQEAKQEARRPRSPQQ
jgi:ElaB/YqjD/DUF883 family membrane-anchored ribosome-binding protein/gas vesicle protein